MIAISCGCDVKPKTVAIVGLLTDCGQTKVVVVDMFSSDETESDVSYGAMEKRPAGTPQIGDMGMNGNLVLAPCEICEKVGSICDGYSLRKSYE